MGARKAMNKNHRTLASLGLCSILCILLAGEPQPLAQNDPSRLQVNVDLVQLSVAVTDRKGNYISGLGPQDFVITEDKIPEKISNFDEGSLTLHRAAGSAPSDQSGAKKSPPAVLPEKSGDTQPAANPQPETLSPVAGSNVFILFDTSNYMYRGFVFAQDAVSDFVRSMDDANKIAFYSYSRNLSRATLLTPDHYRVVNGVRSTVAGDDAALYNSLLLTVKDAARFTGRKAIVVFSNGPDNASSVPPEDVAELAQSTGTIIYIVSTRLAQMEPVSAAAFERMSKATGGNAYFAGNWSEEKQAFAAIRNDLGHLYSISYYPQLNPNRGWRTISVKLVGKDMQKYHIRTRDGYVPLKQTAVMNEAYSEAAPGIDSK